MCVSNCMYAYACTYVCICLNIKSNPVFLGFFFISIDTKMLFFKSQRDLLQNTGCQTDNYFYNSNGAYFPPDQILIPNIFLDPYPMFYLSTMHSFHCNVQYFLLLSGVDIFQFISFCIICIFSFISPSPFPNPAIFTFSLLFHFL